MLSSHKVFLGFLNNGVLQCTIMAANALLCVGQCSRESEHTLSVHATMVTLGKFSKYLSVHPAVQNYLGELKSVKGFLCTPPPVTNKMIAFNVLSGHQHITNTPDL